MCVRGVVAPHPENRSIRVGSSEWAVAPSVWMGSEAAGGGGRGPRAPGDLGQPVGRTSGQAPLRRRRETWVRGTEAAVGGGASLSHVRGAAGRQVARRGLCEPRERCLLLHERPEGPVRFFSRWAPSGLWPQKLVLSAPLCVDLGGRRGSGAHGGHCGSRGGTAATWVTASGDNIGNEMRGEVSGGGVHARAGAGRVCGGGGGVSAARGCAGGWPGGRALRGQGGTRPSAWIVRAQMPPAPLGAAVRWQLSE